MKEGLGALRNLGKSHMKKHASQFVLYINELEMASVNFYFKLEIFFLTCYFKFAIMPMRNEKQGVKHGMRKEHFG